MEWKIKKGDFVVVHTGTYKGITGEILSVVRKGLKKDRIFVKGVNMVTKHQKGQNEPGSIVTKEAAIHRSNVSLFDAESQSGSKVGIKVVQNEPGSKKTKVRFFKKSGTEVR